MLLEIDVEGWPAAMQAWGDWEALAVRAAEAAGGVAPEIAPTVADQADPKLLVSVLFTTDAEVHALNREWRDRDKPTNVLSFPMMERDALLALTPDGPPEMLGDIALAYETCAREAEEKGVSIEAHAAHLIIHGLLHLAGYDHVHSEAEAEAMEALEIAALAKLGVCDPYADRDVKE